MTDTVNKALQRLKNDRTRARVVSQARKVKDVVDLDKLSIGAKDYEVAKRIQRDTIKLLHGKKRNVTYRTQGKQDLLEGKPRKTTVSAKAGAGMQMLKAQMRRFGAKQWWQSKTH